MHDAGAARLAARADERHRAGHRDRRCRSCRRRSPLASADGDRRVIRVLSARVALEREDGAGRLRRRGRRRDRRRRRRRHRRVRVRRPATSLPIEQPVARRGDRRAESRDAGGVRVPPARRRAGGVRREARAGGIGTVVAAIDDDERPDVALLREDVDGGRAGADEQPRAVERERRAEAVADRRLRRRQRRGFLPAAPPLRYT